MNPLLPRVLAKPGRIAVEWNPAEAGFSPERIEGIARSPAGRGPGMHMYLQRGKGPEDLLTEAL